MLDNEQPTVEVMLLPCPFCGEEGEIERFGNHRHSTIYRCTFCSCSLETGEEWGWGKRWNTRIASTPASEDAGAALAAADYLISLYERLWKGGVVRDLAEAIGVYEHLKRAALPFAPEQRP